MNSNEKIDAIIRAMSYATTILHSTYNGKLQTTTILNKNIQQKTRITEFFPKEILDLLNSAQLTLKDVDDAKEKCRANRRLVQAKFAKLIDEKNLSPEAAEKEIRKYFTATHSSLMSVEDEREMQAAKLVANLDLPYVFEDTRMSLLKSFLTNTILTAKEALNIIDNTDGKKFQATMDNIHEHIRLVRDTAYRHADVNNVDLDSVIAELKKEIAAGNHPGFSETYIDYVYTPALKDELVQLVKKIVPAKIQYNITQNLLQTSLALPTSLLEKFNSYFYAWNRCMYVDICPSSPLLPFNLENNATQPVARILADKKANQLLNFAYNLIEDYDYSIDTTITEMQNMVSNKTSALKNLQVYGNLLTSFNTTAATISSVFTPEIKAEMAEVIELKNAKKNLYQQIDVYNENLAELELPLQINMTRQYKNWNDCYINNNCSANISLLWQSPINFTHAIAGRTSASPTSQYLFSENFKENSFRDSSASLEMNIQYLMFLIAAISFLGMAARQLGLFSRSFKKTKNAEIEEIDSLRHKV